MRIKSISRVLLVSILLVMSSFIILDDSTRSNNLVDIERNHILAQTSLLGDSGFESGGFSVWTNELDTVTNTIQSAIVHSGSYALRMESVLSAPSSWRGVHQVPSIEGSLADNATLSAAIYPLVTGNTCGEYGQASVVVFFYDSVAAAGRRLIYVWSGYDFPGTDTSVNISRGYFKFYQWSTSTWHILERDLLVDYTACYGAPSDPSAVNITRLNIYNHYSNGAPGIFYADDVQITSDAEPPVDSEPETNWLTGWMNRKSHQIQGVSGAGTNYQVKITVNYGTGIDSNNTVFTDFECQPDFDDIRFTDDDGMTLLDFWRETYFDSDNATFWVEVRDNLGSDVSIYMYYGNPGCTTTSNGTATFVFFDDFDDGTIDADKWETYGPWTESGGSASFSIVGTGGTSVLPDLMTDGSWDMRNKSIVSRWRVNALTVNREWGVSCANTVGDDHTRLAYFLALNTSGNDNVRSYYDASAAPDYDYYNLIIGQYPPSVFMTTEFVSTPNNVTKNSWILDGNVLDTYSGNSFDSTLQRIFLGFYVHGYTNTLVSGNLEMEFDFVYLKNQVGSEIAHGSWSDYESWLDGWDYRKSHEIIGSTGAGENYQIEIAVHYGYGTDSGKDVYCRQRSQRDFDDIRFTDDDGHTLLDYWTESVVESDEATFWVEIRDNLDTDVSIYLYFGNTTCTTTSNGTATFAFFDDFETGNLDRWDIVTGWSISSSYFTDGVYGAYSSGGSAQPQLRHNMNQTESFLISIEARTFDNFNTFPFLMSTDVGSSYPCTFGWTNVLYHTGSYSNWPQNSTLSYNTWYNMQIGFDMSLGKVRGWKNDNYMGEVDFASTTGATPSNVSAFRPAGGTQSTRHLALDNVYIRKWIPLEPTHGAWEGPSTVSWYHDCSNTTGFTYNDTWNMNWMSWDIQTGTLASDGSMLSVTSVVTGSGWHGPVFEYELPRALRVRDIENLTAVFDVDNSINSYVGYEVLMFGDSDRNPVIFYAFHDGWAASRQGSYGVSYGFLNGSRVGYGSGYPVGWTSFSGIMNTSFIESGLQVYVEGVGESILTGLSEADFNREIKYVAIASARFGSDPLIPVRIDEIYLNYEFASEPAQPSIDDVEDFGYEAGTTENMILWNITNFTPTSYELYRDSGLLSSGVWPGGTQLEVDIDNLAPGEYNYTIVVFGGGDISVSDTVIITVTDSTSPSLGHPMDVIYEYGTTEHSIVWSVSDLYPSVYFVIQDEMPIDFDVWTSGTIEVNIDGLSLGEYNFSILVSDTSGNAAIDSVIVTVVDTTAPILTHPSDIMLDLGATGIQIDWQPTDLLPFNYEIYQNGTQVSSGTWTSGENLTYTLDELVAGAYNITIVVWDTSGNYGADTVFISIESGPIVDYMVITISMGGLVVIVVVVGLICRNRRGPPLGSPSAYDW